MFFIKGVAFVKCITLAKSYSIAYNSFKGTSFKSVLSDFCYSIGPVSYTHLFEMTGYNRSKPDDERNPESLSVRGCRQIFEGAYI